jgi:hypothetical protein
MVAIGCSLLCPVAGAPKHFSFEVFDKQTIRKNPTTQVAIRVAEWPGQTFLLWLPEVVGDLWVQWDPAVAHQDFVSTPRGGLRWETDTPKAHIVSQLTPRASSLLLETRVKNLTSGILEEVRAQNCLHLSAAPDFACRDFSSIYIRTGGTWRSLADLGTSDSLPMFYRPGFLESGRRDSWGGLFRSHNQNAKADHPLMIAVSPDGKRAIGTASEDYQCVFHNHGLEYLLCIHSQQSPVRVLGTGRDATFRQMLYFVDGTITDVVRSYEADLKTGALGR